MEVSKQNYERDVVVVGAGPVGCVSALAHAAQGATVTLLEANEAAANRLAGEWLHPPAVKILSSLGVDLAEAVPGSCTGRGFAVYPNDGDEPVMLPYANGAWAAACEHSKLVAALRSAVRSQPNIDFVQARVTEIDNGQTVFQRSLDGAPGRLTASRVVAADGRGSFIKKHLGMPTKRTLMSYMAGLRLDDVTLPQPGFGHVFLGGPGPVLAYHIGPRQVRICMDVPNGCIPVNNPADYLWAAFGPVLPPSIHAAVQRTLATGPILWAANHVTQRTDYGAKDVAFVGDVVGSFHPLTASGISVGFMDAVCLARSKSLRAYRRERRYHTQVSELLSSALYDVFTREDDSTVALRQAIFRMWRNRPDTASQTMRLLAGEDTSVQRFSRVFLRVMGLTARQAAWETLTKGKFSHSARVAAGLGQRLQWLTTTTAPYLLQFPASH